MRAHEMRAEGGGVMRHPNDAATREAAVMAAHAALSQLEVDALNHRCCCYKALAGMWRMWARAHRTSKALDGGRAAMKACMCGLLAWLWKLARSIQSKSPIQP